MRRLNSTFIERSGKVPSAADLIKFSRKQIDREFWFLKRHLINLEQLVKKAERDEYFYETRVMEELSSLVIMRSQAVFRHIGEVHRAISQENVK